MEVKMFFPLLLLICSVSAAQPQTESDSKVVSLLRQTVSQGKEAGNAADHQQSCTPDIQSVMREMSALLAELKVEVKYLQRDNEVQGNTMTELEKRYQTQEAKMKELELQKTKLKQHYQAHEAKMKELELQKTELKQHYQAQAEELIRFKVRTNITENLVEALKREGEVKRVAFSASLYESGSGNIGPFSVQTPLVFKHVVVNIGNAYNPNTGFFIAPVRGAYHFEYYIFGHGHASHGYGAVLIKNGEAVFIAYGHLPSHTANASNGATLLLEVGDVVFLRQWANSWIHDSQNHHTTFSGHLLFTM